MNKVAFLIRQNNFHPLHRHLSFLQWQIWWSKEPWDRPTWRPGSGSRRLHSSRCHIEWHPFETLKSGENTSSFYSGQLCLRSSRAHWWESNLRPFCHETHALPLCHNHRSTDQLTDKNQVISQSHVQIMFSLEFIASCKKNSFLFDKIKKVN